MTLNLHTLRAMYRDQTHRFRTVVEVLHHSGRYLAAIAVATVVLTVYWGTMSEGEFSAEITAEWAAAFDPAIVVVPFAFLTVAVLPLAVLQDAVERLRSRRAAYTLTFSAALLCAAVVMAEGFDASLPLVGYIVVYLLYVALVSPPLVAATWVVRVTRRPQATKEAGSEVA